MLWDTTSRSLCVPGAGGAPTPAQVSRVTRDSQKDVVVESDHHALRNVGLGHVVEEEGGEEEWSAHRHTTLGRERQTRTPRCHTEAEGTGGATTPQPSMAAARLTRKAAALAAARPTLLFRPL